MAPPKATPKPAVEDATTTKFKPKRLTTGLYLEGTDWLPTPASTARNDDSDVSDHESSDGEQGAQGTKSARPNTRVNVSKLAVIPASKIKQDKTELDKRIRELKLAGYSDANVEIELKKECFFDCNAKTVASRWRRVREEMEKLEDEKLDDELTDWHEGEDDILKNAEQTAEAEFQKQVAKLEEKKWKAVSRGMLSATRYKKYTANACKDRFMGIMDGTADLPIEADPDQEGRRIKRETRIAAARKARAEQIEAVRFKKEEKERMEDDQKLRKLKHRENNLRYKEERIATKAEDRRLQQERREGKEKERKMRAEGLKRLKEEAAERSRIREAESRVFNYYTGRHLIRKQGNRSARNVNDVSDDDEEMNYLLDSDDNAASVQSGDSTASFTPKRRKVTRTTAETEKRKAAAAAELDKFAIVVTKSTLLNPRSVLSDGELDVLLFERGLPKRGPSETHPEVVARLAASDDLITSTALNELLEKHFEVVKGNRAVRVKRLQEADAATSVNGKNGIKVTSPEFKETYEGYSGKYAGLMRDV